jgi:2'-5' RNA ligase
MNDLSKKSEDGYHPHLTLGRFSGNEMPKRIAEFQQGWKEFSYLCRELHMIERDKDTPFVIKRTIRLAE